jgi:hypothetical protein
MQGRQPVVDYRLHPPIATLGDRDEEDCKNTTPSSTPIKSDVNNLGHFRALLYEPDFLFIDCFFRTFTFF